MVLQLSYTGSLIALAIAPLVYLAVTAVYNLFFSPLSRFPGPPLWAISRVFYVRTLMKGDLTRRVKEFHDRYGPVVRLAPNELSFIDGQAWQDVYGHHHGGAPNFPKNPIQSAPDEQGIDAIISANDADHARYRRLLSHSFSDKVLREQEYLPQSYITLLMTRLRERAGSSDTAVVDISRWINFATFDIIGDLAFGESFHCLEQSNYHEWVTVMFSQFKTAIMILSMRYLGLEKPVRMMLPKSLKAKKGIHASSANEKIRRRLAQGAEGTDAQRNDFMTYILRYNNEKGMSVTEIECTFRFLVVAGSETIGTALTAMMGCLLKNPEMLDRVTQEVRQSFPNASQMTSDAVSKLPYLAAVIEEGLRVCPPVSFGTPRVVPAGGAKVSGYHLQAGTFVSCPGYASNHSALNFPDSPSTFNPERWLSSDSKSLRSGAPGSPFNPFSIGPRNCLGRNLAYLEMRLILANLLWQFDFEQMDKSYLWEKQKVFMVWQKDPLMVKVKMRS
ncbi:hypothetical protein IMSHALPRED_004976 [Imshaugia aleurites]|uniref:Cytochrome P450 n=1 Tax=Imshaugia aleurites TaxID=172621 RepID=A0A8H3IMH1_9LECA|nr:hypothetical protein IMSHALPRED_004976 [Imshaugia aleurites]